MAVKNWRRLRKETRDEGDWGLAPFAAHQFGFLAHFTTVPGAVAELDRHGFSVDAVFSCNRPQVLTVHDPVDGMWMHLACTARA